jgi:hypothetical protein
MTQPSFVPITEADQVRPALRLQVPAAWSPSRPADHRGAGQPTGRRLGTPGPDQGFALRLAHRRAPAFKLTEGEHLEDVVIGCALVAARRAALFGRAPSIHDLNVVVKLFGFESDSVPEDLVVYRRQAFDGVSHDYQKQRALVDSLPEETLRLTPAEVALVVSDGWRELLGLYGTSGG